MSKDIPIIYSGPMVRAQLEDRKTMTRRILDPQPKPFLIDDQPCDIAVEQIQGDPRPRIRLGRVITKQELRFAPGDRLWVRESLRYDWVKKAWLFAADNASVETTCGRTLETPTPDRWPRGACPSIHMARQFTRLTNIVTGVKIERLQDISEADAIAEGLWSRPADFDPSLLLWHWQTESGNVIRAAGWQDPRAAFFNLWQHINGEEAYQTNPFVVAISFRVIKANIDSEQARAAA